MGREIQNSTPHNFSFLAQPPFRSTQGCGYQNIFSKSGLGLIPSRQTPLSSTSGQSTRTVSKTKTPSIPLQNSVFTAKTQPPSKTVFVTDVPSTPVPNVVYVTDVAVPEVREATTAAVTTRLPPFTTVATPTLATGSCPEQYSSLSKLLPQTDSSAV